MHMSRYLSFFFALIFVISLLSCDSEPRSDVLMADFLYSYGAEGVVYSSSAREGEVGYASRELLGKVYIFEGEFPKSYALLLNSKSGYGSECGFFVAESESERERIVDMCEERLSLLTRGEGGVIISRGRVVFYSSLSDGERAEKIAKRVIASHD